MSAYEYDLIPTPFGEIPRWKADAMVRGTFQRHEQIRADAAIANSRAAQAEQAERQALVIADLVSRIDALSTRFDGFERAASQAQADAEAQQQHIQAMLDALPSPDDPQALETHGELTTLPPTTSRHEEQLAAISGDAGGVPLSYGNVPVSYVHEAEGDLPAGLTNKVPPTPGTEAELSGARQPTARNPAALTL